MPRRRTAAQATSGGASGNKGFAAKAASGAVGAAGNMAKAAAADVGRKMAGQTNGRGSAPWRMAADMAIKRRLLSEDAATPEAPNTIS